MNRNLRWFEAVADCEQRGEPYVLVTVVGVTGSVPREPSSKMVITGEHTWDTIGGGHLEYLVTARAREQLAASRFETVLEHFPLGASLGQCCGGSVSVLLEGQPGSDAQLVVFGAGHVAQALMAIMGQLPWQVTLVDARAEVFPADLAPNIRALHSDDPVGDAPVLCRGRHVLILTHNHQLDYDLCRALLDAGDAASIGLIGSQTKADRFRQRLAHRGYSDEQIACIRCPVGRSDVPGKRPMEVAVSISAELLSFGTASQSRGPRRGVSWPQLRDLMKHEPETPQQPVETK
ncbi:xanthine dehydrogenase accessory protein XdhC [Halopseudomonas aestusnigri]|jgi:xanthine dehydrogenase accessory factor|uniref:xanthine dehydrogenase accessory protein XdhC n=1 Tax=Halopseudomonas aestusnigri TaxID=857252 RepID=UPI000C8D1958|nr:xanthine dehydrogenase accessory protein XdhC [Halopseudomonas aestusnigri]MAP75877.1 xanthine dehydrogenase accessory protein XdhC [Pseudomonadales bacterium]UGV30648.1 xanthine dehydrogenase accessory protein XdhC [Halopseudomonas aestusnigri]|tara:strand:- start:58 stop:930 length:873 start_codon:yes stop_codon:yes gene_type:complete